MPKPSSVVNLKPRGTRRQPVPDDVARKLEDAAEAMGNGVAGVRGREAVASQPHEPTRPGVAGVRGLEAVASQADEPTGTGVVGTMTAPRVRKDGTRTRSTSLHVPVDLGKRLAVHCAENGRRQNDVIVAAIERYLAGTAPLQ